MAGFGGATEFISRLDPPRNALAAYDNTKTWNLQAPSIPKLFLDALSVREEVFGQQGVPLEVEVDEDDARSYHWVTYASVAQTSSPQSTIPKDDENMSKAEQVRRSSATANRVPVGTIRLIPPPHGPNPYKHPDAGPPAHPVEPYIKLGRLSVLGPYRGLGLAEMLINAALEYATANSDLVCPAPSPTTVEAAGREGQQSIIFNGLVTIHAQVDAEKMWSRHGFTEELLGENGQVEIAAEDRWVEEGIEHMAMWKRINVDIGRL